MSLVSKEFLVDEIKLNKIYSDFDSDYEVTKLNFEKIDQIYGELKFPQLKKERPFLFACFVASIDGTIAFKDNPKSGQIARNNNLDNGAGKSDLWILNLLRTIADGIILGPKTLAAEPNLTGHIFDQELVKARTELLSKSAVPYNIIVSQTGDSIPYQHRIFTEEEVPIIIATSPQGSQVVTENLDYPYQLINLQSESNIIKQIRTNIKKDKVIVLATGDAYELNEKILFNSLKEAGLDRIMVETPSYAHYLMQNQFLDELFWNQAGIYAGGPKFLNNDYNFAFSSAAPPQAKMITIHSYNSYFFCFRYRLNY
ncbi:dihydrofolate reductase family protein [Halanaerobacter jeridensis]|uniref:Riboflavin biosynthesis pyrimidine reductase n=1 Tax=Halanaerobacter jeridensis TaxID=706427 RepID=A0A939BRH3_9FIRM|nr:dihydrofolate reductase family protein [Halanaerobacter jeridensis]MBM7555996.1 riboflavin biosynthesis pyrimidine reductase [Halanaerobacter jeridensis]